MAAGAVLSSAAGGLAWGPLLPDKSSSDTKICAIKDFSPSFACSYVLARLTDLRNSKQVSHRQRHTCTEIRQAI